MIESMWGAYIAAGADGPITETHADPAQALSASPQSLKPKNFTVLIKILNPFAMQWDEFFK